MSPERWQQVEAVLETALDREENDRAAYLEEACFGDPDLRGEVESLLAMQGPAARLMTASALASAEEMDDDAAGESMVGRNLGVYEVVEEISHGGMGEVYLAKRADDEYQRCVAVKLIKRGMDTRAILHRFRQERQILAGLDHPNIAKLLDGGTTEDGQSYLVMEYVEGLPIDAYCDTHKLSTIERLDLFRTVCSAVHYAHQNLIVHRDLKPANILITAGGVPKLLDFGIAKIVRADPGSPGIETATVVRLMTPDYASPEQVRGQTITTASDVYSLGVLLYELLTGHRPYRLTTHRPHEIERVICEQEPEKPSAAISRIEEGWRTDATRQTILTPESVSRTREGLPEKLRRKLTGDVDNIVLMALRKEPHRRYASVEQFAEDIGRFLADRPVIARKDTVTYRGAKFVRRNKLGVLAASLVTISLIAGMVAATWEARRANQQRIRAEQQESENRRVLYAAQMNLAYQAWEIANTGRVLALLDAQRPKPGREDLRGFEWSYLWRLSHGDLFTFPYTSPVMAIGFSADGRTLVTASGGRTVTFLNVVTKQKLYTLDHTRIFGLVAFGKDSKTLALADFERHVVLWDTAANQDVTDLGEFASRIMCVALSPDGKWLAAGLQDNTAVLWDVSAKRKLRTLTGHTYWVDALAFSPDGKWLATGSAGTDNNVMLWDLPTGRRRATLRGHTNSVSSIMFSPDSRTLATGSRDATARLWDLATKKELGKLDGLSTWVRSVVFSPDGQTLATGGTDSTVKLWNVATRSELATLKGHADYITDMAFSSDGTTLATGAWDSTVKLWDVASYRKPATLSGHAGPVHAVAFSPNGKLIAMASHDHTLTLWDRGSGREVATLGDHSLGPVFCVAWSPSGETLATGGYDRTVRLRDVATGKELAILKGHQEEVRSLDFSPDGKTLATGSMDGAVKLWDVKTRQQFATLNGEVNDRLNSLAVSRDGRRLAVGYSSGRVALWDLATRRRLSVRKGHTGSVNEVRFSPNGRMLASAGWDRSVKFWDAATLQEIDSFQGNPNELECLAFSPDGKTLATGGGDRMVKLWDVATRQELATLKGHTELISALSFSPDGMTLASASYDRTVRLWQAAPFDHAMNGIDKHPK